MCGGYGGLKNPADESVLDPVDSRQYGTDARLWIESRFPLPRYGGVESI